MTQDVSAAIPEYLAAREQAKWRDRLIQLVAVVCATGCVVGAALLLGPIDEIREESQLLINPDELGTLPADIVLLSQTGTFRALAFDVGFIRLEKLKEEGRFYELMQLSNWLCKLVPRYAAVWAYNAWNQAYNISVCEYTAEGRWLWVENGLKLLRDEGLKYNPKSITLYKELAWIYWHKIGDIMDDHHWHYKMELAVQMERVLGAPDPRLSEEEHIEQFKRIADAPKNPEQLIAHDADVADFVRKIRTVGLEPDKSLLQFVARYVRPDLNVGDLLRKLDDEVRQRSLRGRLDVVTDETAAAARDRLLAALRSHVLRTELKLDPQWMLHLMERFGPIEWRTPYAHALYWSYVGDMKTQNQLNLDPNDSMNTVRYIFFALVNMVHRGRLVLEPNWEKPNESFINLLPDARFIEHLHQTYIEMGRVQFGDDPRFRPGTSGPNYWVGHVNFLRGAMRHLYFQGDAASIAQAKRYLAYLTEYDTDLQGKTKPQYLRPLETLVLEDIYDALMTSKAATMLIGDFISRSLRETSLGNADAALGYLAIAKKAYHYFMKEIFADRQDRRKLEKLPVIYENVATDFLQSPANSVYQKVRLWHELDLRVRRQIYDALIPYLTDLCEKHDPPLDVAAAFRVPPGMEQARKRQPETRQRQRDASEGEKDFNQFD